MDHCTNNETILSLNSDYLLDKATSSNGNDSFVTENFINNLREAFKEEISDCSDKQDKNGLFNSLSDNSVYETSLLGSAKMLSSPEMDFENAFQDVDVLKGMIKRLIEDKKNYNEKYLEYEEQLADYEIKLSEALDFGLKRQTERDALNEALVNSQNLAPALITKLEEKEAELKQYKHLVIQLTSEDKNNALKKQLSDVTKDCERAEKSNERLIEETNRRRKKNRTSNRHYKKLLARCIKCAEVLNSNNLLSPKESKSFKSFIENAKVEKFDLESVCQVPFLSQEIKEEMGENQSNHSHESVALPNSINSDDSKNDKSYAVEIKQEIDSLSDDVENLDNSINIKDIMVKMIMKIDDLHLISPLPASPLKNACSVIDKKRNENDNACTVLSSKNAFILKNTSPLQSNNQTSCIDSGVMLKENPLSHLKDMPVSQLTDQPSSVSTLQSNEHKNRLFHQVSQGFEPHIEETLEKNDLTTKCSSLSNKYFLQEPVPPNVHCISSFYSNNTLQILHQGVCQVPFLSQEIKEEMGENQSNHSHESVALPNSINSDDSKNDKSYAVEIKQEIDSLSDDVENLDNSINIKDIMVKMIMKIDDLHLISPLPASPLKNACSYIDKKRNENDNACTVLSSKNAFILKNTSPLQSNNQTSCIDSGVMLKENPLSHLKDMPVSQLTDQPSSVSTLQSNEHKNRLFHQVSQGFEPHIEETLEKNDLTTKCSSLSNKYFLQEPVPPNVDCISSFYSNNTLQILHQGNGTLDYFVNSDNKIAAFMLTVPKQLSNNSTDNVLPCLEERRNSVLSLYDSAIKQETPVIKRLLNLAEDKTDSVNDPFSYVCVQIDSKRGQVNVTSNLENNFISSEHNNSSLIIEESKNRQTNLTNNLIGSSAFNKHPCNVKEPPPEVIQNSILENEYIKQKNNDNQALVSDSCDISSHDRKVTTISHYYDIGQNDIKQNENNLSAIDKVHHESNETIESSENNENKSVLLNKMNKPEVFAEIDNKMLENSKNVASSSLRTCNLNSTENDETSNKITTSTPKYTLIDKSKNEKHFANVNNNNLQNNSVYIKSETNSSNSFNNKILLNDKGILTFGKDVVLDSITTTQKHISIDKNKSEDEMHCAVTCDNSLQNNSTPIKNTVNSINLDSRVFIGKAAISPIKNSEASDKIFTSTPKHIDFIDREKSQDKMHLANICDNNAQSNSPHVKSEANSVNSIGLDCRAVTRKTAISPLKSGEISDKIIASTSEHNDFIDREKSQDEMHLANICDNNVQSNSPCVKSEANSVNSIGLDSRAVTRKTAISPLKSGEISDKIIVSTPEHNEFIDREKSQDVMHVTNICDNNAQSNSLRVKSEANSFNSIGLDSRSVTRKTAISPLKSGEISYKIIVSTPEHNEFIDREKSQDEMHLTNICDNNAQSNSPRVKSEANSHNSTSLDNKAVTSKTAISPLKSNEISDKIIISTPKHNISTDKNKSEDEMSSDTTILAFEDEEIFKTPIKQARKNEFYDMSGNSKKIAKDLEKITVEHSNLNSEIINVTSCDKINKPLEENISKIHNLYDLSSKKFFVGDIEPPASKRRKLPEKSPLDKMESTETINNQLPNSSRTITESSREKLANFQSFVHLIGETSISRPYGVFTRDNNNFNNSCDGSKDNMLNKIDSLDSTNSMETAAIQACPKSLSINVNKDLIDVVNKNYLPNVSAKKQKKKRNREDEISLEKNCSTAVSPKKHEISFHNKCSQNSATFLSTLEANLKTLLSDKQLIQNNNSKNSFYTILGENEMKSNLKSAGSEKSGDLDFNTQISSSTKVNNKNICNIASVETNTIRKNLSSQHECLNIGLSINNKNTDEKSETTSQNTDQVKLRDKDNLLIKNSSNNQLKTVGKKPKGNSSNYLLRSFNHKEQYNPLPSSTSSESAEIPIQNNGYQSDVSEDENPIVAADEEDSNPNSEIDLLAENQDDDEKPLKTKQRKRKKSKTSKINKRKKSQSSCEEESACNSCTIEKALNDIKKTKFEEMLTNHSKYKLLQHKLINAFINPVNASNTVSLLHQVFNFLSTSKLNPLTSYRVQKSTSVFYPPSENCIVEALIKTESKNKVHLKRLISSAILSLYYLILDKKSISKTGLGAFCRIFTQLCKHTNEKDKPIKLICDLIKEKHPYAPVLVAFIIGTWVELFVPSNDKDVFRVIRLSTIYLGLQKKPSTVKSTDWNACKAIFSLPHWVPLPMDIKNTTEILFITMREIVNDPPSEKDEWTRDQMVILAVNKGWTWTQEVIVNSVIDLFQHYAENENNERAFSFFAELCADIGKLAPDNYLIIVDALVTMSMDDIGFDYVKKHALCSLLKLLLFKDEDIHPRIRDYIRENFNLLHGTKAEFYLRRKCIAVETELTESDIMIA